MMIQIEITTGTINRLQLALKKYNDSDEGFAYINNYTELLDFVLDKYLENEK